MKTHTIIVDFIEVFGSFNHKRSIPKSVYEGEFEMIKTLVINAHPKVDTNSSLSLRVYNHFLEEYKKLHSVGSIEQINLYSEYVPKLDNTVLSAWEKLEKGTEIFEDEQNVLQRMSMILQQFQSASRYVIVMPLHNFNVPSKLKDYLDNIIIPSETFRYMENGSYEGLLTGDRSVLVIQASDSVYTNNDWYSEIEYSHKYLKSMFKFIGIEAYQIIRAQGNGFLNQDEILAKAFQEAETVAKTFAEPVSESK